MKILAGYLGAAALALSCAGETVAQVRTDAYVLDGAGAIWREPFGPCWRTTQWTPAKAIAECDPDLVPKPKPQPKPQPVQPVPAPAPAPVPVPVPAPVVVDTDADGDGVVDRLDRCPGTPAGAKVDAAGCEIDGDGDGVLDRLDRCPGTKAGAKVDANGCEIPEVVVLKGVNFATNSARLTAGSAAILDEAAAVLAKRGDVRTEVAGHTDNRGSAARNRALSQERAETVMRYLISKGVAPGNLSARGYGPDNPIADNRTESGRAANRRVELRILR